MSNTTDYTVNNAVYEQARRDARARYQQHWFNWDFNMWDTYHSVLNPTWVDPWFEHELEGIYNGPSAGSGDPAYEMTQNLYGIYNWMRYKGYKFYSITAMMTSAIQESTITGGLFEARTTVGGNLRHAKPYDSITAYDPVTSNKENATWYTADGICVWTAYAYDDELQQQVSLTATPGSWPALLHCPIKMDEAAQPLSVPVYPLQFNQDLRGTGIPEGSMLGYGLCQWTPWHELSVLAGLTTYAQSGSHDGSMHWQLNLTLQLMVWEYQRYEAMHHPDQSGSTYHGYWVNRHAQEAGFKYRGVTYTYGQSLTWDQFAHDDFLPWVEQKIVELGITDPEEQDNCKRQLAVSIWGKCYLHAESMEYNYETLNMQQKSLYVISALKYWEETYGWDVRDIPRARDISHCELDQYHTDPRIILLYYGRRKNNCVRTVLF